MSFKDIKDYKLIKVLGKGSSSTVFLGLHKKTKERVAVKKIDTVSYRNKSEALLRFKKEAEIISELSHPNILQIYEVIETEDALYLVMEYFEGKTLKESFSEFTLNQKIFIIKEVASALISIHKNNIVHMDLKPGNILVKDGDSVEIRLIDFGLAHLIDLKNYYYQGTIIGSFNYISPEQTGVLNRTVDNRSDLYSLGVSFYEILSGTIPFSDKDIGKLIHKHLAGKAKSPSFYNEEIPKVLDEIVLKLLKKEPGDRYHLLRV